MDNNDVGDSCDGGNDWCCDNYHNEAQSIILISYLSSNNFD